MPGLGSSVRKLRPQAQQVTAEVPRRLTPTGAVTRELYLRSGNRCAYPGCAQPLMTADGVLVGQIAHIEAALSDGKRFRPSMTNEDRRRAANLLLLCGTHHLVVDADDATWTVAALQSLKAKHEAIYTGAIDRLRSTVGDITDGTTWYPALNAQAISGMDRLSDDQLAESLVTLNEFASRLAAVPLGARTVLSLIIDRGAPASAWSGGEVDIPGPVLEQLASCSKSELMQYLQVLEHFELVSVDFEPFEPPWMVTARNSTPTIGWPIMTDLLKLARTVEGAVRRVIVDLDFTVFDQ